MCNSILTVNELSSDPISTNIIRLVLRDVGGSATCKKIKNDSASLYPSLLIYTDRQKKPDTFSCCIKSLSLVRGELFFVCKYLLLLSNDSEIVFGDNHLIKTVNL